MRARLPWGTRNPVATPADSRQAVAVARAVGREYARRGARAVVLSGSWARGDARRHSDVDLWVVGRRERTSVELRRGFLVTVKETTVRAELAEMRAPRSAGQAVRAWREGKILHDPWGVAEKLRNRAARFRWEPIGARSDRFIGRELASWAEEAVKLTRLRADGSKETAAVQRNLLVDAIAGLMAVRRRMLYDENSLWESMGAKMGTRWHRAQRLALGADGPRFDESCEAALELYRLTVRASWSCLTPRERRLVAHACRVVGRRL